MNLILVKPRIVDLLIHLRQLRRNLILNKTKSSAASPVPQESFEKSDVKPFSPFQSSESTVKRQQASRNALNMTNKAKIPGLNLQNIKRPNFHEEFMDVWQEF